MDRCGVETTKKIECLNSSTKNCDLKVLVSNYVIYVVNVVVGYILSYKTNFQ